MTNKSLVIVPLAFSLLVGCGHNKVSESNTVSPKPTVVVSAQDSLDQSIKSMDYVNKTLDQINSQLQHNNDRILVMRNAMEVIMSHVCPDALSSSTAKDFPDQVVECQKIVEANNKGQN